MKKSARRAGYERAVAGLLMAVAALSGCGKSDPLGRQAVSGVIKLDGELLEQGAVSFVPTVSEGQLSGATIMKGEYKVPKEKGLPPGEYEVRVFSSSGKYEAAPENPGESIREPKDLIPPKYNIKSELKVTVEQGKPNVFDFDLASK